MKINKLVKFVINQGFGGEIPMPVVYTFKNKYAVAHAINSGKKHGVDGCQIERDGIQYIGVHTACAWDDLLDTVVHELCHVWQDANNMPTDHGKKFQKKMVKVLTALKNSV